MIETILGLKNYVKRLITSIIVQCDRMEALRSFFEHVVAGNLQAVITEGCLRLNLMSIRNMLKHSQDMLFQINYSPVGC